jgi:2-polyprenyl-3-methyl-5-hydroxy-6-metoxy-1,4-benzoquinol methylase
VGECVRLKHEAGGGSNRPNEEGEVTPDEAILAQLAERLGDGARGELGRLPSAEVRYLASRPDLVRRYRDGARGLFLFIWEMSAVARGEEALAEVERAVPFAFRDRPVLDVGCSDGGLLVALARRGAVAHGVDVGQRNVRAARRRAREWKVAAFSLCGSACELPYRSASFAAVTCGDVIEHLPDRRSALREVARVLVPGGVLWLAAPTRFNVRHLRADPHFGCFGVAALPRTVAAWVVVRVAHRLASTADYDVETLPSFRALERDLEAAGFGIVAGQAAHLRDPATVRTPWKQRALRRVQQTLPGVLARPLARGYAELFQPFRVVCRKRS